jgi:transcriptional regulator with XRE-family HTH domain
VKTQQAFGKVVRRRREKAGLSQEALADKAGLHRNYIGLLERGLRTPSIEVLRKVAIGLGTTMSSLIRDLERLLAKSPSSPTSQNG